MSSIIAAVGAFLLKAVALIAKVAKPIAKVVVSIAKAAPKVAASIAVKVGASAAAAKVVSSLVKVGEFAVGNWAISRVTRKFPKPIKSISQDIGETVLFAVLI